MPPLRVVLGLVTASVVAAGCSTDDSSSFDTLVDNPQLVGPVPMIVDYSPTLSDIPALMFLATHPDVELLAVTLAGTGESDCEPGVRHTRALLEIAGRAELPVACGPESPMSGDRDWPLAFRGAANTVRGIPLPRTSGDSEVNAVDLLTDTLRDADQPVTIVTLGPLTNLGYAIDAEPGLAAAIQSIVTMGGAFDVPGNVFDAGEIAGASPDAEWNIYIDPESLRVVLESGAPVTFVPLDATNYVPGEMGIFARLTATAATDSGEAVRQLWEASLGTERSIAGEWWYFWDELAAVVAVEPSVATISERSVAVDDLGVTTERDDGTPATVASAADPERFEQVFLETFAGGELPASQLTDDDEQYLGTARTALAQVFAVVDEAFVEAEAQADEEPASELAAQLVSDVFGGMGALHEELSGVETPDALRTEHEALIDSIAAFRDLEETYLDAFDAAAPAEPLGVDGFFELFFRTTDEAGLASPLEAFEAACGDLELTAFALGATEPVCLA